MNLILIHFISSLCHLGCGNSCMAIVSDPGQDLLGGEDVPDAPMDPNAPQIRVSQDKETKKHFRIIHVKFTCLDKAIRFLLKHPWK